LLFQPLMIPGAHASLRRFIEQLLCRQNRWRANHAQVTSVSEVGRKPRRDHGQTNLQFRHPAQEKLSQAGKAMPYAAIRMTRTSITLVCVSPVMTRSPVRSKKW